MIRARDDRGVDRRGRVARRRFYEADCRAASRASGFEVLNGDKLVKGGTAAFLPPPIIPFRDYLERPVFLADAKLGRTHWDLEILSGFWFISEKMESLLQAVDPEAFAFLECEIRSPDGNRQPPRWLCDVVRVVDAVDETQSTMGVGVASDGSKIYRMGGRPKLVFKESAVGGAHVFRMKYFEPRIICDDELKQVCKLADLKGISFADQSK